MFEELKLIGNILPENLQRFSFLGPRKAFWEFSSLGTKMTPT
jgi:hypothetical protein